MTKTAANTLTLMDQGSFLWVQASGHVHCIQSTWVYRRAVDIDGLHRLRHNLAHGMLGRRVERSPLWFGRHRWVAWPDPPDIDIAAPLPTRAALPDWIDERAQVPIDPERGPCWHLGVVPLEDYGSAVSLVVSHTVADGLGLCVALADAVAGITPDLCYPPPGSRPRGRALADDARLAARAVPGAARALVDGARLAFRTRGGSGASTPPASSARTGDRPVTVPAVTAYIDLAEWDHRAEYLGGNSNSLFAGFSAKLAEHIGRTRDGGRSVTLTYPVSDRTRGDTRGNALKSVDLAVDPTSVTADLRRLREDIKRALTLQLGNYRDQEVALPIIPFVPKTLVRRLPVEASGAGALPVGCSNFGEIDRAVACADGTPADYLSIRLVAQNLTGKSPELKYGELFLSSGRIGERLFIAVRCYRPGAQNSRRDLGGLVLQTLADFDLTGFIE